MARRYFLEQIDDAAVVQYYADGFEHLAVDQKVLAWHLSQAALAGRDIYYDQRYGLALDMRDVLEEILLHAPDGTAGLAEVRRYTKLFWIHSGPHNHLTSRKFVLRCTPAAFADLVRAAERNGARFRRRDGESLSDLLARLNGPFFDPAVDTMVTSKSPGPGHDILTASANNLYAGVTARALEGFVERYGFNSRLVKADDRLEELVYRQGGHYGEYIERIVGHLRSALAVAPPATRRAIEALVRLEGWGEGEDGVA
jgi:dipeptidyl-peptidase-3